ncbi:MAG TPA: NAD(P)H-dependent oxidoreductase [Armatimonadota bacterium]|nr:NAD(P)H-dependent oxidoreductase [Armatimonadota bacterium]
MATLLHVFAHPRPQHSQTLRIAEAFLDAYRTVHPNDIIDELDLYRENVPHLTEAHISAMLHQGEPTEMSADAASAWNEIMEKIKRFTSADKYLITAPMWNFSVPSVMKAYIDHIVMAGYTFRYTGPGASIGMMEERPMVIVSSRGGIYSQPPMTESEMCVRYLRNVFDFLGFDVISEIVIEGLALVGPHEKEKMMQPVLEKAREVGKSF